MQESKLLVQIHQLVKLFISHSILDFSWLFSYNDLKLTERLRMQLNKVKITLSLEDTFLDLSYYKVQIVYWDKETINRVNQSCFKIGSLMLKLMQELDNLGQELEVEFKIKNNPIALVQLQNVTGQRTEKESRYKSAISLTETVKDATRLKEFLKYHNCTCT